MPEARPRPRYEGSLQVIYDIFLYPLVQNANPDFHKQPRDRGQFLDDVFGPEERQILNWITYRDFPLPGLYYAAGNVKLQGVGFNKIKAGSVITSRHVVGSPTVDVEFYALGKEHVFCLDIQQWTWISYPKRFMRRITEDDLRHWREFIQVEKRDPEKECFYEWLRKI